MVGGRAVGPRGGRGRGGGGAEWGAVALVVDQALVVYRLGAVSAFKAFHDCAVGLESSLTQVPPGPPPLPPRPPPPHPRREGSAAPVAQNLRADVAERGSKPAAHAAHVRHCGAAGAVCNRSSTGTGEDAGGRGGWGLGCSWRT